MKEVPMITQPIRWKAILGFSIVLVSVGLIGSATGQNGANDVNPTVTFEPLRSANGAVIYRSGTMLVRTRHDIFATIRTSGLTPGVVYTGWIGIFNNPKHCATRPCGMDDIPNPNVQFSALNFGGQLVGRDGTANYAEVRAVGDATNPANPLNPGPGLLNPRGAEIHLVVRSHGPALADPAFAQQLTLFDGGCPPNFCADVQEAVHAP